MFGQVERHIRGWVLPQFYFAVDSNTPARIATGTLETGINPDPAEPAGLRSSRMATGEKHQQRVPDDQVVLEVSEDEPTVPKVQI